MTPSKHSGNRPANSGLRRWLLRLLRRRERVRDARKAHRSRQRALDQLEACLRDSVGPALAAVRDTLNEEGYAAALERLERGYCLRVVRDDQHFCVFRAEGRLYHKPFFAFPALHGPVDRPQSVRLIMGCEGNERVWQLRHCRYDAIYQYALDECRKWLNW
ncbi:hypothetical protein HC341_06910 [Aquisalimonas sp. 2447]|uniref:hypothetical protein n=1 Tax=Aquisalimonas sp. 2447 TaxID=2740807 RepID=UPI001432448D|nr:hypothetical protein [Aquisalimonas sp. 2447]QIT54966.1 hypothetical protein HC341_06910 [Aquisalimonas sp. 2447]